MGTQNSYPRRVPKPAFSPNEEQRRLLAATRRAYEQIAKADAKYKELLAQCAAAEITVAEMAETMGVERKTIYRHLGRKMS